MGDYCCCQTLGNYSCQSKFDNPIKQTIIEYVKLALYIFGHEFISRKHSKKKLFFHPKKEKFSA
jgi:hypothetical protein